MPDAFRPFLFRARHRKVMFLTSAPDNLPAAAIVI
jgi:hypothetical protein